MVINIFRSILFHFFHGFCGVPPLGHSSWAAFVASFGLDLEKKAENDQSD